MTKLIQPWNGNIAFPGGNTAKNAAYTGPARSLSIDTNKNTLRIHDGVTAGGVELGGGVSVSDLLQFISPAVTNLGTYSEFGIVSVSVQAHSAYGKSITHSISSGSLPPGLTLDAASGTISGTIGNVPGNTTYNFTVQASDGINTVSKNCTLSVTATNDIPVWVTASALGNFTQSLIDVQLVATDADNQVLTYTLAGGALPPGVSLTETGQLIGNNPMNGNTYNFTVNVTDGNTVVARSFSLTAAIVNGETVFTTPGTYNWTVPQDVTSISAVCISGGSGAGCRYGGKGGSLSYLNNIAVTPGETLSVVVGAGGTGTTTTSSTVTTGTYATGNAGTSTSVSRSTTALIRASLADVGGACIGQYSYGGNGGSYASYTGTYGTVQNGGGGGGAGGYAVTSGSTDGGGAVTAGVNGAGGGGGRDTSGASDSTTSTTYGSYSYGHRGAAGGGVGLYGRGSNGTAGSNAAIPVGGGGGSGGSTGTASASGLYGAGGGGGYTKTVGTISNPPDAAGRDGGNGAVRIIWGTGRSFPSNAA